MTNRLLAVISSPFQLFCLNELIKQKEIVNVKVLLLYNKQSYKAYQEASENLLKFFTHTMHLKTRLKVFQKTFLDDFRCFKL